MSSGALLLIDVHDVVSEASAGAARLLDEERVSLAGRRLDDLLGPECVELDDGVPFVVVRRDRVALALVAQTIAVIGADHDRLVVLRDVSDDQRRIGDLSFRADHEPTTRLPNRAAAVHALAGHLHAGMPAAVVAIELDRLTALAPLFGEELIGTLVSVAARRIELITGPGDLLAHSGPSQLVLIRGGVDDEEDLLDLAVAVLDAIGRSLEVGASVFLTAGHCGVTIGRDGDVAEEVLRDAVFAVRAAVDQHLDVERFRPVLREVEHRHLLLGRALREALAAGGLELFLQPVIDLHSGRIAAFESLARWTDPHFGRVAPDEFIGLAERVGLIRQIGEWGVSSALEMIERLRARDVVHGPVAVNLSPTQLLDAAFVRFLVELVEQHDAAGLLSIEVTEGILASPGAVEALHELAGRGISIAIDDFGTGFSALSYLTALPARVVKIDRSFVLRLAEERTRIVVRAIIALAHALGLRVIAEGVETEEVLTDLQRLGCDAVQGYWTGAPAPFDHWLAAAGSG